jgi:hypothetical protein
MSLHLGVGQFFAHVSRDGVPRLGRSCGTFFPSFWLLPYATEAGVG